MWWPYYYLVFCVSVARIKGAGHGFAILCFVSRATENEREEGVDLMLYLPLVPLSCLAISALVPSLSLPPWMGIATLFVQC